MSSAPFRPLPTDRKVRWGVLGCAAIATRLVIPAIQSSGANEVVAIASRDPARARQTATELGIPRHYDGYEALLADAGVDAVYIPLPNSLHHEWTIRAAQAGKHVLCEKPAALTVEQVDEMLAACRSAGVLFMEGLMYRLHPQHARVRQIVVSGLIGAPRLARASFTFHVRLRNGNVRFVPALGGGALYDAGVYAIDSLRYVLGREPRSVAGHLEMDPEAGVDVGAAGVLAFDGGVVGLISASFEAAGGGNYEIVGSEGRVFVEDAYAHGSGRPARVVWSAGPTGASAVPRGEESFPPIDQYLLEVDAFAAALRSGTPPPIPDDAGRGNIAVIEALRRAAATGGTVAL